MPLEKMRWIRSLWGAECETELRGLLENGAISEYQVTLKVGFRVLERDQV